MIQGSLGNISLFMQRTALVGDVVVSLCFGVKASACSMQRLISGGSSSCSNMVKMEKGECVTHEACFPQGSEESCVCFAVYLIIKDALTGTPLAASKSKASNVVCGYNNEKFIVSWHTKGTGSAVRKSLGIAFKVMNVARCFPVYDQCVKSLGHPVSKEYFQYAASSVIASIKKDVTCCVVGNIKIEGKKKILIDDALVVLSKKMTAGSIDSKGTKPDKHNKCNHSDLVDLKAGGFSSFILKDYIASRVKGIPLMLSDKGVLVAISEKKYQSVSGKLKNYVDEFVKNKCERVGPDLGIVMSYLALSSGSVACCDLKSILSGGITASAIKKMIEGSL